jgi:hypothetical protein
MFCIQHRNNTNGFVLTELRHMEAALCKHDMRELLQQSLKRRWMNGLKLSWGSSQRRKAEGIRVE